MQWIYRDNDMTQLCKLIMVTHVLIYFLIWYSLDDKLLYWYLQCMTS